MAKIRIKSQWFRPGADKTPEQTASAVAFTAWRVAQNMLKQMRVAQFDIAIGEQYFAFTREVLVFLTQVLDRMAYERMSADERVAFVTALVKRVAEILQDNEDGLLGQPAAGEPSHYEQFIDLFNELADHYADFGFDAQGPDFDFVRYLGYRIELLMPKKDQRWVLDQVMAAEVPDAIAYLQKSMDGVLSTEPRAPRPSRIPRGVLSGD
ncbi:MAG: hypothetical protein KAX57_13560 [Rhodoferax sp.]|uniref:hypothetical protein n=1 Tax=Rhodoferax sp. TaxID=50421 RepID=UPI001B5C6721|nr:hypothetical protein [Rhodoferax sp.]MBP8287849.1 hypothetical protein [Rhodoferax sp.]MBP9149971.1 hypothetical protein [Rhodoferax sp.]MBP9734661.1 hypothetical protein [Rhodoferax sp.]